MENNVICIKPETETLAIVLKNAQLLNEFYKLGFKTKASFIQVVQDYNFNYKEYKEVNKLVQFYVLRTRNEYVINDVQNVLNQLKNE